MRGSNLAGTISGKPKMVYDVLSLNPQMRVTYVLTLSMNYSPPAAKFIINKIIFLIAIVTNKIFRLVDGEHDV